MDLRVFQCCLQGLAQGAGNVCWRAGRSHQREPCCHFKAWITCFTDGGNSGSDDRRFLLVMASTSTLSASTCGMPVETMSKKASTSPLISCGSAWVEPLKRSEEHTSELQ